MKGSLYRLLARLGPFNTISISFFAVYALVLLLVWDDLDWAELDLIIPGLAFLATLGLGWSVFLLKKRRSEDADVPRLKGERSRLIRYLLEAFPLLLIYQNIELYGQTRRWDELMFEADRWMTGTLPSLWAQNVYSDLLTEIMSFSYLIYLLVPIAYMLVYRKKDYHLFRKFLFATLFIHFIALLLFIVVPVEGPKYYYADEFTKDIGGWAITDFNGQFFEFIRSSTTDCFPSMHVGLFLLITYYMYSYSRKSLVVTVPLSILMSASTLYLRYHYLTDLVAAVLLLAITIPFTELFFRWWSRDIGKVT